MTLSHVVRTAALALTAAAVSLSAAQAAPPNLVSASPGPKAGYGPWPKQLRMTFDQPLAASGHEVQLMDPDGRRIRLGAPVASKDGLSVPTELTDPPVAGPYMVTWQAKSASGDQAKGDYTFFVQ